MILRCAVCSEPLRDEKDHCEASYCPHTPRPEAAAQMQRANEAALRYDAGKLRYDLIPADALEALAVVYTRGAAKYADRNWEKGMSYSRCFGSLMRHIWAFWRGEQWDGETGCHHMAMAAWNCFALLAYSTRGVGTDDRPNNVSATPVLETKK